MIEKSLAHPAPPNTRESRALALHRERRREIILTGRNTYEVPSCTGSGVYTVEYGGAAESCNCPDARRLAALEEQFHHELMDSEERCELLDRIRRIRRRAGL